MLTISLFLSMLSAAVAGLLVRSAIRFLAGFMRVVSR